MDGCGIDGWMWDRMMNGGMNNRLLTGDVDG